MLIRRLAVALPRSRRFFSSNINHDLASHIAELNKEMESVFGEPPSSGNASSVSNEYVATEPKFVPGNAITGAASGSQPIGFNASLNCGLSAPTPPRSIKILSWKKAIEYFAILLRHVDPRRRVYIQFVKVLHRC